MDLQENSGEVNKTQEEDDLILRRKGGGSIIRHRPLFSSDGETLLLIWRRKIRAYSARTGDLLKECQEVEGKLIGISIHPNIPDIVVGCTDAGNLIFCNYLNGLITSNLQLDLDSSSDVKIKYFHILKYKNEKGKQVQHVLISYSLNDPDLIRLSVYNLKDKSCIMSKTLTRESNVYYIDIVGNHGDNLIAVGQQNTVFILDPAHNLSLKAKKISRTITCIAGHPDDQCVAVGDSSGRVVLMRNLHHQVTETSYHWHTLPVIIVAFSKSGGHMYTGGGECVLVKWTLANPQNKAFLPRLPAPIKHITIAPENSYIAISTVDNGISVVNPQLKLTTVIQKFTWGVANSSQNLFPAGLVTDPRTDSLVFNSRTGFIQFYDVRAQNLLYNINITSQNFLTQERNTVIVNTEVTKIALNYDGTWMATVEVREDDNVPFTEVRLKFWNFDAKKQIFVLNTSVEYPHEYGVTALKFQPNTALNGYDHYLVTSGKDKKFKLWELVETKSGDNQSKFWQHYGEESYHNYQPTDATFHNDGSILAVGFNETVTLWAPDSMKLRASLASGLYPYTITYVEFGKLDWGHLVVSASKEHIAVWDMLTLRLRWSVPLDVATIIADPRSNYFAVFTTGNNLYVFTTDSADSVYKRLNVTGNDSSILAAAFLPHDEHPPQKTSESNKWQKQSQLFFLDSNQELLTLESKSDSEVSLETLTLDQNLPATAFANILATENPTSREEVGQHNPGSSDTRFIKDFYGDVPCHLMPPPKLMYRSFLLRFNQA